MSLSQYYHCYSSVVQFVNVEHLKLWVRIPLIERCTWYNICDKGYRWLSSTNKTDCHNIAQLLFKVALNNTNPLIFDHLTKTVFNLINKYCSLDVKQSHYLCRQCKEAKALLNRCKIEINVNLFWWNPMTNRFNFRF